MFMAKGSGVGEWLQYKLLCWRTVGGGLAAWWNVDKPDVVHAGRRWCWDVEELSLTELVELYTM